MVAEKVSAYETTTKSIKVSIDIATPAVITSQLTVIHEIPPWNYRDPFVSVHQQFILISALHINLAYQREQREFLEVFLSQYHVGKIIVVRAMDGENLEITGFLGHLRHLCDLLDITDDRVIIISTRSGPEYWQWIPAKSIIFWSVDRYIGPMIANASSAKLFGISIARFSPLRHRALQIFDQCSENDIFMVCNYTIDEVQQFYGKITDLNSQDISWMQQRRFDQDRTLPKHLGHNGTIPWQQACEHYPALANNYCIEIIIETDFYTPEWLTEKTSKCLYTGKPFLLVGGRGSLAHLRSLGFVTLDGILDESYDQEPLFDKRIDKICQQMKYIQQHPNRQALLGQIAERSMINQTNWSHIKHTQFLSC